MISGVKAVVFDWAGTMVDFGSFAPMKSFVAAFDAFGVEVTLEEARGPMGLPKRVHIQTMIHQPRIATLWQQQHGAAPTDADIDAILARFEPINARVAADHADLIPGALDMLAALDQRGMALIEAQDPMSFAAYQREYGNTICGQHPISVLLRALALALLAVEGCGEAAAAWEADDVQVGTAREAEWKPIRPATRGGAASALPHLGQRHGLAVGGRLAVRDLVAHCIRPGAQARRGPRGRGAARVAAQEGGGALGRAPHARVERAQRRTAQEERLSTLGRDTCLAVAAAPGGRTKGACGRTIG